jgi:hypothetical protein
MPPLPASSVAAFAIAGLLALAPTCAAASQSDEDPPDSITFSRDIVPVLTKAGCNSGQCHGSLQGRGGFRLSLLGFDPLADYEAILRQARGRRVSITAPTASLILRKASGQVPHGGGRRFEQDSRPYRIVRDYLAQGAPPPNRDDPHVRRLVVAPAQAIVEPGGSVTARVTAQWSDGVERDVTSFALFDVTDESRATVDRDGRLVAERSGKVSLLARFGGLLATLDVAIPYAAPAASRESAPAPFMPRNYIDELLAAEWQRLGVSPSAPASDDVFLRRVSLDLIGALPTPDETRRFLDSTAPDKRDRLIDELLDRPEYVDLWALRWADLLRAHRRYLGDRGLESFLSWIRQAVRENRPVDVMTRELLTAQGNVFTSGNTAPFFIDEKPEELAETVSQVFLGVRLQCARCHHHPFEVWSQEDHRGLAAFFTNLEMKDLDPSGRFGGARILRATDAPVKGRRLPGDPAARVLTSDGPVGSPVDGTATGDLRTVLANWITAAGNPYFARNIANRLWKQVTGRGIVEPVDDQRASNPPSSPALLDALADDLVRHGYDAKHLLRTICQSAAYQLSFELAPNRDWDGALFTHRQPRRLSAEVLLDAVNQVTGASESFPGLPAGTRAVELPDPSIDSPFLSAFGRPDRSNACDCARLANPDLSQTLTLANNSQLQAKIAEKSGRLARLLAAELTNAQVADELYLAAFSRTPSPAERKVLDAILTEVPDRREAWEDILWSLLNSPEFLFQH